MGERRTIVLVGLKVFDEKTEIHRYQKRWRVYDQETSLRTIFSWADSEAKDLGGEVDEIQITRES